MTFVDEILTEVRQEVAEPDYGTKLPTLPPRPRPSFKEAIERGRGRGALVVEYKRVSPGQAVSELPVRPIEQFLGLTAPSATAYSCLATEHRFRGSPSDVAHLARSTERPVLFKDFVIDPRQVDVAARTGASALLLITRLPIWERNPKSLRSLAGLAHAQGLEVVLEFHHRSELSRATDVPADVYGVNVRDLATLKIDRATAETTLAEARALGLHPLLGLSGVESPSDARRFWTAGADGILVGTAVARAPDPSAFLASLRRPREDDPR